jgi:DNA-binding transcriptional regulator LsrR (DeoR family)
MRNRHRRLSCTQNMAGQVLWLVYSRHYTQSQTAVIVGLNAGTVCHIVHGRRFLGAHPVPVIGY